MYNFKISKTARHFGRSGKNRGYPKGWPSPLTQCLASKAELKVAPWLSNSLSSLGCVAGT